MSMEELEDSFRSVNELCRLGRWLCKLEGKKLEADALSCTGALVGTVIGLFVSSQKCLGLLQDMNYSLGLYRTSVTKLSEDCAGIQLLVENFSLPALPIGKPDEIIVVLQDTALQAAIEQFASCTKPYEADLAFNKTRIAIVIVPTRIQRTN